MRAGHKTGSLPAMYFKRPVKTDASSTEGTQNEYQNQMICFYFS